MDGKSNPRWVIDCRNCRETFVHSEIGSDRRLVDYLYPTKPEFPTEGAELERPCCQNRGVYKRTDLRYESGRG
jgi:hypothetical protein